MFFLFLFFFLLFSLLKDFVELRLEAALPAFGRRIAAEGAKILLLERIPAIAQLICRLDQKAASDHVACIEEQESLRGELDAKGLVAFVAEGSMLARASGDSDLPMKNGVPFSCTDESLRITLGKRSGMGIPKGVTLIVGGGNPCFFEKKKEKI